MRWPSVILTLLLLAIVGPARADARLVPSSSVELEILGRNRTEFVVDVTNRSDTPARFESIGLYFVPNSGEAAQRLGVVTAPRVVTPGGESVGEEVMTIAPQQTVRLVLTAYCLDEHREGPDVKTNYHLAGRRIPTALSDALAGAAQSAIHDHQDPQRAVWDVRAKMPATLLGELPGRAVAGRGVDQDTRSGGDD